MVDLLAVSIVLAFTLVGFLRGILRQALSVAAVLTAYLASAVLAAPLAALVLRSHEMSSAMAYMVGRFIGGALIFISLSLAVRVADKRFGRTRYGVLRPWNRNIGALAGLLFGLVLAFSMLCVLDAAWKAMPGSKSPLVRAAEGSRFRTWITAHNPADRLLITDSLKFARIVRSNPKAMSKLQDKPEIQELFNDPAIQRVVNDEELMRQIEEAVKANDPAQLLKIAGNENIRNLLADSDLRRKLLSPEVRTAIAEATREAEEDGTIVPKLPGEPSGQQEEPAPGVE
jgi:uncharacterized membrane protein required for colicin V production